MQALQAAEDAEAATKSASIQAHKTALDSAQEAIKAMAQELGYTLPAVRVTDNLTLGAREYAIRLKGVEIARFELKPGLEPGTYSWPLYVTLLPM